MHDHSGYFVLKTGLSGYLQLRAEVLLALAEQHFLVDAVLFCAALLCVLEVDLLEAVFALVDLAEALFCVLARFCVALFWVLFCVVAIFLTPL